MRFFTVRNRDDHTEFASPAGWTIFANAHIFEFRDDDAELIEHFRSRIDPQGEMVEIVFRPMSDGTERAILN